MFNGSSGFGEHKRDYILIRTELIYNAGLHLSLRISFNLNFIFLPKQILPNLSILGWNIFVQNTAFGGTIGYSLGSNISTSKTPLWKGVSSGPSILA